MAHIAADRIRETTTTTGTGAITLAGAVTGFRAFSSVMSAADTCYYAIVHQTAAEWETGLGTYAAGTLTRTTVLASSNAGAAVAFSAGTKDVLLTLVASRAVTIQPDLTLSLPLATSPTTPDSGGGELYLRNVAGVPVLHTIGADGSAYAYEQAAWETGFAQVAPGSTTVPTAFGTTATTYGDTTNITRPTLATTNTLTSIYRQRFPTATTANSAAGMRGSASLCWRGNAAGRGGFRYSCTFGFSSVPASVTNAFVGLRGDASQISGGTQPSALVDMLGIGFERTQTTLRIFTNDSSGVATSVDLGANFPVDTTSAYTVIFTALPNAGNIFYEVLNIGTGDRATGTLSSDLPTNTTFLTWHDYISINSAGTAAAIDVGVMTIRPRP